MKPKLNPAEKRQAINLSFPKDLIERAKKLGFNISRALETALLAEVERREKKTK